MSERASRLEPENERLRGVERDYGRLCRGLGAERVDEIVREVKEREIAERQNKRERVWELSR